MFIGLEHTAIASPDPKRLADWYCDYLGFHINFQYEVFYFVKAPNGSMLEIIPSEGERPAAAFKSPGIRHLAIEVSDFDEAYKTLLDRGVKIVVEPYVTQGNRLVFFEDCDGNVIHLIKRPQPLP
jgi:glyoxylase I family protein